MEKQVSEFGYAPFCSIHSRTPVSGGLDSPRTGLPSPTRRIDVSLGIARFSVFSISPTIQSKGPPHDASRIQSRSGGSDR